MWIFGFLDANARQRNPIDWIIRMLILKVVVE